MSSSVTKFVDEVSQTRESGPSWRALEDLAGAAVGHRLFTLMQVGTNAGLARRAHSNHPAGYPVSGTRPIHRDAWFEIVHGQKRSFVPNSIEDIAEVFPDHATIASLECGSVPYLPVVLGGELVSAVDLLDEAGHCGPDRVAAAEERLAVSRRLGSALAHRFAMTEALA